MPKQNNQQTVLYIVRHGESEANADEIIGGNPELTDNGVRQIKELADKLSSIKFDLAFSSDYIRARHTAEIIVSGQNLKVTSNESLRERSYGEHEGKTEKEYMALLKNKYEVFNTLSHQEKFSFKPYDTYESAKELVNRFMGFINEVIAKQQGKTILIVCHGVIMRVLLVHIGYGSWEEVTSKAVDNGAYVKLVVNGDGYLVEETSGINLNKQNI